MLTTTKHNPVEFNYNAVDPKDREFLKGHARQVNALLERTAANIIAIGQHLQAARDQLPAVLFARWIYASFDFAPDTGRKYMLIAKCFGGLPAVTAKRFQPTALHLLCSKMNPPKAVLEALSRAKAGEPITTNKAAEIIHRHRPPEARKINRNDQLRLSQYLGALTRGKDESEIPEIVDELERQAVRLRNLAGGNGEAEGNGHADGGTNAKRTAAGGKAAVAAGGYVYELDASGDVTAELGELSARLEGVAGFLEEHGLPGVMVRLQLRSVSFSQVDVLDEAELARLYALLSSALREGFPHAGVKLDSP